MCVSVCVYVYVSVKWYDSNLSLTDIVWIHIVVMFQDLFVAAFSLQSAAG